MSTLVTGGAGFIGSNLVEDLLRAGEDVLVLDNMHTGSAENLAGLEGRLELIQKSATICPPWIFIPEDLPSGNTLILAHVQEESIPGGGGH